MSSSDQGRWQRLGRLLAEQRGRIDPNATKFAKATGLNGRLIYDLENAKRTNYTPAKLAQVEEAYRWDPGSIRRVLDGGDPRPLRIEIARLQGPPGRPPIEAGEPDINLRGEPMLQQGEELTAWAMEDGRLHCRYISPDGDVYTAPVSGGMTVEEVVKRVRMIADLTQM